MLELYAEAKATNNRQTWAAIRPIRAALKGNLQVLQNYINEVAKGNESVILSAGVDYNKTPARTPAPERVEGLNAQFANETGKIELLWATSRYARFYEVFMSTEPSNSESWVQVNTIRGRKLLIDNLASGTRSWFKVRAIGVNGAAQMSEPADQIAA